MVHWLWLRNFTAGEPRSCRPRGCQKKELRQAVQTINNYYMLVVEAHRLAIYIDVCACTEVFILFYMKVSHY